MADDTLPLGQASAVNRHTESKIIIPTNTQKRSDLLFEDTRLVRYDRSPQQRLRQ